MTAAPTATKPPGEASDPTAPGEAPTSPPATVEACPLCGAPLDPRQDWCLRCGAAARTRLAATPNWKAPIAAIAVVLALALGVLAAALVKLAGDSGPSAPARTTTVTTAPTASVPIAPTAPTASTPSTATTAPTTGTASTPGASTPTVTAQPGNAGGIASPSTTPTVTAKRRSTRKALRKLPPSERGAVEKFLERSKANSGR